MYDRILAVFCLALAILIGFLGIRSDMGSLENPGPGFMPMIAAGLIFLFSCLLLLRNLPSKEGKGPFQGVLWKRIFLTLFLLFLYSLILQRAGFLVSTFLIMSTLFRLIEKPSWSYVIFWGAIASGISFLIFDIWLEVSLPKGFFGF